MDPTLLNPGFREAFTVAIPPTEGQRAEIWKDLQTFNAWEAFTAKWSQVELSGVYGLFPGLPEAASPHFPTIHVGTPLPAGTRGYRGISSNVILHDVRDRMLLSIFRTHVLNHMPGDDQALNLANASALASLIRDFGTKVDSSLLLGSGDQARKVTKTIFDALAFALASTAFPPGAGRVPASMLQLLAETTWYLPYALGLAQMWRRMVPDSRRGQIFSTPQQCVMGDLFMAAHECAHMFAKDVLPAAPNDLRSLAEDISAVGGEGLMGDFMKGARLAVADDRQWAALLNEVSADYVAHRQLRAIDDSGEMALEAVAYQGAVAWMSGCRAIGSMTRTPFERIGSTIIRFHMSLLGWRHHDVAQIHGQALDACMESWAMIGELWSKGLLLTSNSTLGTGRESAEDSNSDDVIQWGQVEMNGIWNSWWSPMNRDSMRRVKGVSENPASKFTFWDQE